MKLSAYLTDRGMSTAVFAKKVGVTDEAVRLWLNNKRVPRKEMMAVIAEQTNGAVTPADFYDLLQAS